MLYFKVFSQADPSISKSVRQDDLPAIITELIVQNAGPLTIRIIPKFKKGDLVQIVSSDENELIDEYVGTTIDNFYRLSDGRILYEHQLEKIDI